jgi:hypothetical protein
MGGMMEPIEAEYCIKTEADQLAEMMSDQFYADRQVLERVKHGETTNKDFLYLCSRLNFNVDNVDEV